MTLKQSELSTRLVHDGMVSNIPILYKYFKNTSIWPIVLTITWITTPISGEPESNSNKEVSTLLRDLDGVLCHCQDTFFCLRREAYHNGDDIMNVFLAPTRQIISGGFFNILTNHLSKFNTITLRYGCGKIYRQISVTSNVYCNGSKLAVDRIST